MPRRKPKNKKTEDSKGNDTAGEAMATDADPPTIQIELDEDELLKDDNDSEDQSSMFDNPSSQTKTDIEMISDNNCDEADDQWFKFVEHCDDTENLLNILTRNNLKITITFKRNDFLACFVKKTVFVKNIRLCELAAEVFSAVSSKCIYVNFTSYPSDDKDMGEACFTFKLQVHAEQAYDEWNKHFSDKETKVLLKERGSTKDDEVMTTVFHPVVHGFLFNKVYPLEDDKHVLYMPRLPESITEQRLWELFPDVKDILLSKVLFVRAYIVCRGEEQLQEITKKLEADGPYTDITKIRIARLSIIKEAWSFERDTKKRQNLAEKQTRRDKHNEQVQHALLRKQQKQAARQQASPAAGGPGGSTTSTPVMTSPRALSPQGRPPVTAADGVSVDLAALNKNPGKAQRKRRRMLQHEIGPQMGMTPTAPKDETTSPREKISPGQAFSKPQMNPQAANDMTTGLGLVLSTLTALAQNMSAGNAGLQMPSFNMQQLQNAVSVPMQNAAARQNTGPVNQQPQQQDVPKKKSLSKRQRKRLKEAKAQEAMNASVEAPVNQPQPSQNTQMNMSFDGSFKKPAASSPAASASSSASSVKQISAAKKPKYGSNLSSDVNTAAFQNYGGMEGAAGYSNPGSYSAMKSSGYTADTTKPGAVDQYSSSFTSSSGGNFDYTSDFSSGTYDMSKYGRFQNYSN